MTIDPAIGMLLLVGVEIVLCIVLVVTIVIVRRHERETRAALGSILRPMNHVFYGNTDIRLPPQPALVRTENIGPIITHRPKDDLYWAMVNDGLIQHTPGAIELDPVLNAERN